MNSEINLCIWGNFAQDVYDRCLHKDYHSDKSIFVFSEKSELIYSICPSPVAAEYYFENNTLSSTNLFQKLSANVRIHLIHVGENFASGALTAFLRRAAKQTNCIDFGIIYLPPPGCNKSTIGRFFVNLISNNHFFDFFLILDSCAYSLSYSSYDVLLDSVGEIVSIIAAFDKTSCMIPLMEYIDARISSFCITSIKNFSKSDFWNLYIANNSVHITKSQLLNLKYRKFLAFSISNTYLREFQFLYEKILGKNRVIHIPFLRRYEWKSTLMPSCFLSNDDKNSDFTCLISSNMLPSRTLDFLISYYLSYWLKNGKHTSFEILSDDDFRWLSNLSLPFPNEYPNFQTLADLIRARDILNSNY